MEKVLVTFANGDTIELAEGQLVIPIGKYEKKGEMFAIKGEVRKLEGYGNDGLIPNVCELFYTCGFFSLVGNERKAYSVSSVVSIEHI